MEVVQEAVVFLQPSEHHGESPRLLLKLLSVAGLNEAETVVSAVIHGGCEENHCHGCLNLFIASPLGKRFNHISVCKELINGSGVQVSTLHLLVLNQRLIENVLLSTLVKHLVGRQLGRHPSNGVNIRYDLTRHFQ